MGWGLGILSYIYKIFDKTSDWGKVHRKSSWIVLVIMTVWSYDDDDKVTFMTNSHIYNLCSSVKQSKAEIRLGAQLGFSKQPLCLKTKLLVPFMD